MRALLLPTTRRSSRSTSLGLNVGHTHALPSLTSEAKLGSAVRSPEPEVSLLAPSPAPANGSGRPGTVTMTARGTRSRFLASVLHNGVGRYVQQLQRLSFSLSRDKPSSLGAR